MAATCRANHVSVCIFAWLIRLPLRRDVKLARTPAPDPAVGGQHQPVLSRVARGVCLSPPHCPAQLRPLTAARPGQPSHGHTERGPATRLAAAATAEPSRTASLALTASRCPAPAHKLLAAQHLPATKHSRLPRGPDGRKRAVPRPRRMRQQRPGVAFLLRARSTRPTASALALLPPLGGAKRPANAWAIIEFWGWRFKNRYK